MRAIHRWQPTGKSPCGRDLSKVAFNEGQYLSEGVTCRACKAAKTRVSLWRVSALARYGWHEGGSKCCPYIEMLTLRDGTEIEAEYQPIKNNIPFAMIHGRVVGI